MADGDDARSEVRGREPAARSDVERERERCRRGGGRWKKMDGGRRKVGVSKVGR